MVPHHIIDKGGVYFWLAEKDFRFFCNTFHVKGIFQVGRDTRLFISFTLLNVCIVLDLVGRGGGGGLTLWWLFFWFLINLKCLKDFYYWTIVINDMKYTLSLFIKLHRFISYFLFHYFTGFFVYLYDGSL